MGMIYLGTEEADGMTFADEMGWMGVTYRIKGGAGGRESKIGNPKIQEGRGGLDIS